MKHKVIGTRGGVTTEEVSCYTCVCMTSCHLLRTTKAFGCGDWVGHKGQRVYWGDPGSKPDLPATEGGFIDCTGCGKCADVLDPEPVKLNAQRERVAMLGDHREDDARMEHVREEIEGEHIAPLEEPKDETAQVCESCGDPDCNRPFPHHVEEES